MVSATTLLFAALAAVVSAAPTCNKNAVTPTLPGLPGPSELPAPAASLVLKKIAVGHGIQNYTCDSTTVNVTSGGALAVLYDITSFYPGTQKTGLSQQDWNELPSKLLWRTPLPLNKLAGSQYGADPNNAFQPAADLRGPGLPNVKFLGHHYFAPGGIPVFDLSAAGLKATVKKTDGLTAPSSADKGITGSGAVAWLQLVDDGTNGSQGVSVVYRVLTAGGNNKACSEGAGPQSVPYAAYYWFFG